jgi:hypothetical protein
MENRKIISTMILILLVTVGAYFAVKKIQRTEEGKSISNEKIKISSGDLQSEEQKNAAEIVQEEKVSQKVASENKTASVAEINQSVSSPVAKKDVSVSEKTSGNSDTQAINVKNSDASSGKIVQKLVSWGFAKSSSRTIKAVIVHTSYNNLGGNVFDFDKVIQEWKDAGVSPHYAIDRDGTIYQLVNDGNVAWHAGVSKLPDGTTDVNGASIGVEVINSQSAKFSDAQYAALNSLVANLKKKYPIKYVLGHDEIAAGRKTDPWGIDWGKVKK